MVRLFVLFVGLFGWAQCYGCETCPEFRLQTDYCTPHAVVIAHVRLRRSYNDEYDYYIVNVNQILRRSFKIKTEVARVFTPRLCGKELTVGEPYILGVMREGEMLTMTRCTLGLKYSEVDRRIRSVLTKRRIDCTCTDKLCGTNTCNEGFQEEMDLLPDRAITGQCLATVGFCSRYQVRASEAGKGLCCWTLDFVAVSLCYREVEEEAEMSTMPPIELYRGVHYYQRAGDIESETEAIVPGDTDAITGDIILSADTDVVDAYDSFINKYKRIGEFDYEDGVLDTEDLDAEDPVIEDAAEEDAEEDEDIALSEN